MIHEPVGFLDSGFGGLSIYQSVSELLPQESTVYVGDHSYIPYGGRSKLDIRRRVKKLIEFLLTKNVKLIVVACNTATIAGIDYYRRWFPRVPIVGVVPVVKTGAFLTKKNSFAVLSTVFTATSQYQRTLIKTFAPGAKVFSLGCPNLLSFVEKGRLTDRKIDEELREIITPEILKHVDVLVLGCTHYPFLRNRIRAIVGETMPILDSGGAVARQVQRILTSNGVLAKDHKRTREFYSTSADADRSRVASILLNQRVEVHHADI